MKLEQFEQVLEVVRTGTFSQAARNLFMSQPNLSQSIRQLEDELNCRLFIRSSEGVIPTEEGRYLIEQMTTIYNKYTLLKDYSSHKEPSRLTLRVAMTNLNRAIPHFVNLTKKYIGSPIDFSYINCLTINDVIEKVVTCQVDFALIGMIEPYVRNTIARLNNQHIEYHSFSRGTVHGVIGPENIYYHRKEPLTMKELASQTLITFGAESEDPSSAIYQSSQLKINSFGKISVNNCYLFYETIHKTPAIGLISCKKEAFYQDKTWKDLRLIDIQDFPLCSESGWIKLRRMPLTDIAAELLAQLELIF